MTTSQQKTKSIPFDEFSGKFEFKGNISVDWDHEKQLKIVKEQWMDVDTQEDKIVTRTLTYPNNIYKRQQLPRFGNSKIDKGVTTLGEDVFMEWSPHLFKGKNSHYIDNYVKDYTSNISKRFPEKLIINNEIQPNSHHKTLPEGKTWWDSQEDDEIMVEKKVFQSTQYYIDTYMIDYVNKHKQIRKRPEPLWKYTPNKFIGDNINEKERPTTNIVLTTSFSGSSDTFIPLHRRRNFRSKYSDTTGSNNNGSNNTNNGSFLAPHLRHGSDVIKYSIKLYDFASLDGIEPKDILDWIRDYNIMGYIKITIPKSRRTGRVCTFAFLNFKNEMDKTNALQILKGERLKFNHSIVSVEDASGDKEKR